MAGVPIGVLLWLPAEDSGLDPAWPDWEEPAGWHSITCTVLGASWTRGAQANAGVLTLPDAGSLTVVAMDPARELDPTNTEGPLAGRIGIGLPVGIVFGDAPAWTGWIDGLAHDLRPVGPDGSGMTVATLTAYGLATRLVARKLVEVPLPVQGSSSRVAYLAELAGVPARLVRTFGTGVPLRAELYTGDAWSAILAATTAELGALGVNGAGILHFYTRTAAYAPAADALQLGCGPGAYPLASLQLASRAELVRNRVTATRAADEGDDAVPQAAEDPASVARYGALELAASGLQLTADSAAQSWAEFVVQRSSEPEEELGGLVFAADSHAADALAAAVTGRARLTLRDDHHGPQLTRRLRYLGHSIDASPATATVRLVAGEAVDLSPGPQHVRIATAAEWRAYGGAHGFYSWAVLEPGIVTWDHLMAPHRRAVSVPLAGHAGYAGIMGDLGYGRDDHLLIGRESFYPYSVALWFPAPTLPAGVRVVSALIRWTGIAAALIAHPLEQRPGPPAGAPPAGAVIARRITTHSGSAPYSLGRGRNDTLPAGTGWVAFTGTSRWSALRFGAEYPLTLPAAGTVGTSDVTDLICEQLPASVLRPDESPAGGEPWCALMVGPTDAAPDGWGWGAYSERPYWDTTDRGLLAPRLEVLYELPSSGPLVVGLDRLELDWEAVS